MEEHQVNPVDLVAFVVEMVSLGLLAAWGWRQFDEGPGQWIAAIALPGAASVMWGLFASPKARFANGPLASATKVLVFGGAVLVATALWPAWAWILFALIVTIDTVLLSVGPWARPSRSVPRA